MRMRVQTSVPSGPVRTGRFSTISNSSHCALWQGIRNGAAASCELNTMMAKKPSNRWHRGQYCVLLTEAGLVGCGIYDVKTAAEFGQAVAIARGTPQDPLVEPEDLFDAAIVDATPQAKALGVRLGMTGREAVEVLLAASPSSPTPDDTKGAPR